MREHSSHRFYVRRVAHICLFWQMWGFSWWERPAFEPVTKLRLRSARWNRVWSSVLNPAAKRRRAVSPGRQPGVKWKTVLSRGAAFFVS